MICSYCGKEITDDSVFCAYCGKETAAPAEEAVTEEAVLSAEEAVTEETVLSAEEDTPSIAEEPRAPKKRRFPLKWLIAAVVAVVAVGALLLNMPIVLGRIL